jgi:hypothetical protein
MIKEQAEPAWSVRPDPATDDGAGKRDRLAILAFKGKQARPVPSSVIGREVADLEALHPYRHGVGVIGVVGLGDQHGIHLHAHAVGSSAAPPNHLPEVVLIAGLAHHFEADPALAELNLHAVIHPAGPLIPAGCQRPVGRLLAPTEQPP